MDKQEGDTTPSTFQRRTLWKAATGISIAIIALLSVAALVITTKILGLLQPVLIPVAIAGILAYLLEPVVHWLRSRKFFGYNPSRIQAILLVYLLAILGLLMLGLSVIVPASRDLGQLFDDRARIAADAKDAYLSFYAKVASLEKKIGASTQVKSQNDHGKETPSSNANPEESGHKKNAEPNSSRAESTYPESKIWNDFISWLKSPETGRSMLQFLGKALHGFLGALGYIVGLFLIPVYLFFFLKDASKIRQKWSDYVPVQQSKFKEEIVSLLDEVNGYLIAYFRGQVLVSIIDGAITGLILAMLGLDYALVIGVSLAIFGVIPFVGIIITAVPALLIAASQSNGPAPLVVALVFVAVQQADGLLIQPKIVGESVGLHPLTVIFSVLFWSLLIGGILGALLAVPLTAAIKVVFRRYIWLQKIDGGISDGPTNKSSPQTT